MSYSNTDRLYSQWLNSMIYWLIIPTFIVYIVFSAILIGPLLKLNGLYTSIKTRAYEYLISALVLQC